MMNSRRFWKMEGAGNDFVVLDTRSCSETDLVHLARQVCPRGLAVGADGVLAMRDLTGERAMFDYLNADGSPAGFCGNGARCAARFAVEIGGATSPLRVSLPALEVRAEVEGDRVTIEGPRPSVIGPTHTLTLEGFGPMTWLAVRAGVDHWLADEPPGTASVAAVAEALFARQPALREQVNVTLVGSLRDGRATVRTFERGSGATLACGSGAWAAASFLAERHRVEGLLTLIPPSGVPLTVDLAASATTSTLTGRARFVFEGQLSPELI